MDLNLNVPEHLQEATFEPASAGGGVVVAEDLGQNISFVHSSANTDVGGSLEELQVKEVGGEAFQMFHDHENVL